MSKYSICILDDKIPAIQLSDYMDDKSIFNRNNFKHLLSLERSNWDDIALYELIDNLYKEDEYELTGFSQHSFFFDYCSDNLFSPDIVIFDWDMGEDVEEKDPKKNLIELLKTKYCLIAVFTEADKDDEVSNVLSESDFDNYKDRILLIKKGDENSVEKLKNDIENKLKLFSFKLNQILKKNTLQSIDNILIKIGKLSFNQFISLFGEKAANGEKELSGSDFIDIFLEKLKYELTSIGINSLELKTDDENIGDVNKIRELWHYRLYHKVTDNIIRKGDILKHKEDYFLVLSSDCHLNKFWNKNLGYLLLIKLHKVDKNNVSFKKRLNYRNNSNLTSYSLSSLVNPSPIEFLTILPSMILEDETYIDFALNSRELSSIEIDIPEDNNSNQKLLLKHLNGYEKILSISEPFISALFLFISNHFSGFGLPDFSVELKDSIKENISKLKKDN